MRLIEIQKLIKENKQKIFNVTCRTHQKNLKFTSFKAFVEGMHNLKVIKAFEPYVEKILATEPGKYLIDEFTVDQEQANALNAILKDFKDDVKYIDKFLNTFLESEKNETIILLKLYEFKSFDKYCKFIDSLNKKILLPLNRINEPIYFEGFDIGSNWQKILIGSLLGVSLISHITRTSFDILIHDYQKYKVVSELVDQYKKQNSEVEEIRKFVKFVDNKKEEINNQKAKEILKKIRNDKKITTEDKKRIPTNDSELLNAISKSIEETSKQIEKGLEIYQAIDVPPEKRYSFPNFQEILKIKNSTQKLIEKKPVSSTALK
ncbi:hypothetical protein QUF90_21415 [Desulfococcaceae bacterium HSG9]|nr:hypothetical protein [Desulfococcaceae bacterium HSG9]